jgi:hypothetical protein
MWVDLIQNKPIQTESLAQTESLDSKLIHLWTDVWQGFEESLTQRGDPWRTPCLCTIGEDGANGRIVVLRRVDADSYKIRFHTDQRSLKVNELTSPAQHNQKVMCLFYSPQQQRQVRFKGEIKELFGHDRGEEWQSTSPQSRDIYGLKTAPKTPQKSADSGWYFNDQIAFDHFKAYQIKATELDVLTLYPQGHERALFRLKETPLQWQGMWVTP